MKRIKLAERHTLSLTKDETIKKLPDYLTKSKPRLLAAALDSRESFNRTVLEITGFDLPELAAALINKRPKENIIEILARSSY